MWSGEWLKTSRVDAGEAERASSSPGVALTLAGLVLQWLHINPIVKRIWTSSYTLYSGGLVVLMLAGFYALIEWKGWKRWAFPLLVIGANSIAIYVMSWTMEHFVSSSAGAALRTRPVPGASDRRSSRCCGASACCWSSGGSCTGCIGGRSSCGSDASKSAYTEPPGPNSLREHSTALGNDGEPRTAAARPLTCRRRSQSSPCLRRR